MSSRVDEIGWRRYDLSVIQNSLAEIRPPKRPLSRNPRNPLQRGVALMIN